MVGKGSFCFNLQPPLSLTTQTSIWHHITVNSVHNMQQNADDSAYLFYLNWRNAKHHVTHSSKLAPVSTQASSQTQQSEGCFIPNLSEQFCMPANSTPTDLQWSNYVFPSDLSTTSCCFSKTTIHHLACFPPHPLKFFKSLVPGL